MVRTISFSDSRELFRHFLEFTPAKRARLLRSYLEKRLRSHLPNLVSCYGGLKQSETVKSVD